jgi:hypothetical protein
VESNVRKMIGRRWPEAEAHPGWVGDHPTRGGQPTSWHSASG